MKPQIIEELAAQLRRRRSALLEGVAGSQQAATAIIEERESEVEENAQKDRIARVTTRLSDRDQETIRQIDAALDRIADGTYGQCAWCESEISVARLRALPTATLCIDCATAREKRQRSLGQGMNSERLFGGSKDFESDVDLGETTE